MSAAAGAVSSGVRRASAGAALLVLALVLATPVSAAGPKVVGTMTLVGQPGLAGIAIVAYQWSARQTAVGGGGGGAGKLVFDPFQVTKFVDATSPALLRLTFDGTNVGEVHIDVPLRRGTTASYVLSDVSITGNDRHTAASGGQSLQTLSLEARAIKETIVSPGGTVTSCWSLVTNQSCD
jgi:type VI secretion system secreted protein Hcp